MDEELQCYNRTFDDRCVQFECLKDAQLISDSLAKRKQVEIIEITPFSYPKYFFPTLQGTIHTTRELEGKIVCIVEAFMGLNYCIAVCDLKTEKMTITRQWYKSVLSVEGAFANFTV